MTNPVLSTSMEDYLKAVYDLGEHDVKTQTLADSLGVSPASVTGMIKKLAGLNLLTYERYRGVGLTAAGRAIALETVRHHRLIETYLAQALGYAWHEVHDEAETLEHVISEDFEERIAAALGDPTHDPHGDPIPRRDGSVPETPGLPLVAFAVGEELCITRIVRQEREVMRYLEEHDLRPGSVVTLVALGPFEGPVTLERAGTRVALARSLAERIHATPCAVDV